MNYGATRLRIMDYFVVGTSFLVVSVIYSCIFYGANSFGIDMIFSLLGK